MLAGYKNTSVLCVTSQKLKGGKSLTHCEEIVTEIGLCFLLLWCSLWVLLLFLGNTSQANHRLSKPAVCDFVPLLVGLCDCSPAGGEMTLNLFRCLGEN